MNIINPNLMSSIAIIDNVLMVFMSVLALGIQFMGGSCAIYFSFLSLGLQILSLYLVPKYEELEKNEYFPEGLEKLMNGIKPNKNISGIENRRKELRYGLKIQLFSFIAVIIVFGIISQLLFLSIAAILVSILAYMYGDYLAHSKYYAEQYDILCTGNFDAPDAFRGLASIYEEEYKKTKFIYKNNFYRIVNNYKFNDSDPYQDECIKNILYIKADEKEVPHFIWNIVLVAVSMLLSIPNAVDWLVQAILKKNIKIGSPYLMLFSLSITFILLILNLISINRYRLYCEKIKEIISLFSKSKKERFDGALKLCKSNGKINTTYSRGIFVFNSTLIDKGSTLANVPPEYKMLYIHRLYANIPRFWNTVILALIATVLVLLELKISWYIIGIVIYIFIIASILGRLLILPFINEKKICKFYQNSDNKPLK